MIDDGSICPVNMPALNPASASNCTPVTYEARGLLRNSNGHACSSGRELRPHNGFGKFAMQVKNGKFTRVDPVEPGEFDCTGGVIDVTIDPVKAYKG